MLVTAIWTYRTHSKLYLFESKALQLNSVWKHSLPVSECTSSDVSTSYRLAARSHEAVTTCLPPTSQSAAITTPWWLRRVVVATRTEGQSFGPSTSPSVSSLSEKSTSSSQGVCCCRVREGREFWKWERPKQCQKPNLDHSHPSWCLRWCQQEAAESAAAPCISRCELSGLRRLRRREKARRTIRAKATALKECHKTIRNTEI